MPPKRYCLVHLASVALLAALATAVWSQQAVVMSWGQALRPAGPLPAAMQAWVSPPQDSPALGLPLDLSEPLDRVRIVHMMELGFTADWFHELTDETARTSALQIADHRFRQKVATLAMRVQMAETPPKALNENLADLEAAKTLVPGAVGEELIRRVNKALEHGAALKEAAVQRLEDSMQATARALGIGRADDVSGGGSGPNDGGEGRLRPANEARIDALISAVAEQPVVPAGELYRGEDTESAAEALEALRALAPKATAAQAERAVAALVRQQERLLNELRIEASEGRPAAWALTHLNLAAMKAIAELSPRTRRLAIDRLLATYVEPLLGKRPYGPAEGLGYLAELADVPPDWGSDLRKAMAVTRARHPNSLTRSWLVAKNPAMFGYARGMLAARNLRGLLDGDPRAFLAVAGSDNVQGRQLFTIPFTLLLRRELPALERLLSPRKRERAVEAVFRRFIGEDVRSEDRDFAHELKTVHILMGLLPWLGPDQLERLSATVNRLLSIAGEDTPQRWPYTPRANLARFAGELDALRSSEGAFKAAAAAGPLPKRSRAR
ncbi:MAG: hypothetical protein HY554_00820 [Elusimicrobia bacterium]|nr:hypothetical protein [Elusimicrobiota bacterium]